MLQLLKHPKIRALQLEVQSLDDQIRKNMNLHKTTAEALEILGALSDKFLISNLMVGFPGHSVKEFNREMRKVHEHHLYFLSLDPYDDTPGTPSHEIYQPLSQAVMSNYHITFLRAVAKERELLLKKLLQQPYIEASVTTTHCLEITLYASHYTLVVHAIEHAGEHYRPGDRVRVKVTGLHQNLPEAIQLQLYGDPHKGPTARQMQQIGQYFDMMDKNQFMLVDGEILGPAT